MNSKKDETKSSWFKQFFIENIWFIFLLAPLFLVAFLVAPNIQSSEKQSGRRGLEGLVGAVEVSAFELVSIVEKPFSELLAMEVYANTKNRYRSASLSLLPNTKTDFWRKPYKRAYNSWPVSDQSGKLTSYDILSDYKKQIIENAS